jgi:DNA-binding PadR family transcriptional regulator
LPDPPLSASAWAVLGLLSFPGERTGYEVKIWADTSLRFFYWSPALSQVYRELKRLEDVGYASSHVQAQDEVRSKRLYRITESGREALTTWARRSPESPPVLKHGVLLRVWLGHLVGHDELRRILREHVEWAQGMVLDSAKREQIAHDAGQWPYPQLALRWSTRYFEAERDLAGNLLQDLDQLEAAEATDPAAAVPAAPSAESSQ